MFYAVPISFQPMSDNWCIYNTDKLGGLKTGTEDFYET